MEIANVADNLIPQQRKFDILEHNVEDDATLFIAITNHARLNDKRLKIVSSCGPLIKLKSDIVDTGHANGVEVHTVCTNAVVVIGNRRDKTLITYLIARPNQLRRYEVTDEALLRLAAENEQKNLNK